MKATEIKAFIWLASLLGLGYFHQQIFALTVEPQAREAFSASLSTQVNDKGILLPIEPESALEFEKKETVQPVSKISINKAGVKELTQIKGIGPKIAEKIINYRTANGPFRKGSDLLKVKGIGKAKLKTLLMRITFEE